LFFVESAYIMTVMFSDLNILGPAVGFELGVVEGAIDIDGIWLTDGCIEGAGLTVGVSVGAALGTLDGILVGCSDGKLLGMEVG
jgi:hypothetical protein